MINKNTNLIEYIGLSKYLPKDLNVFKKVSSTNTIKLPENRLDIKYLTKVSANISILETKLITTATGKSFDGLVLSGKKILCYGFINYKFHYISIKETQNIQLYTIKIPFVESVITPSNIKEEYSITTSVFVDDIMCTLMSENEIFSYISFIINCD